MILKVKITFFKKIGQVDGFNFLSALIFRLYDSYESFL